MQIICKWKLADLQNIYIEVAVFFITNVKIISHSLVESHIGGILLPASPLLRARYKPKLSRWVAVELHIYRSQVNVCPSN
jgi:hypothetical protein